MTNNEVQERFIDDTKDHSMTVINDDEENVTRHLMFSNNGSSVYRYDIHTWPGYLMVTGDMGTYVFRRIHDMFDFFDTGSPNYTINPGYWSEKLEAINSHCGSDASIKEYKDEKFSELIKSEFNQWVKGWEIEKEEADEVWDDIVGCVLNQADDEQSAYHAAYGFEHDELNFYECNFSYCREYNYHFRWILYAIVDGIKQYKDSKNVKT